MKQYLKCLIIVAIVALGFSIGSKPPVKPSATVAPAKVAKTQPKPAPAVEVKAPEPAPVVATPPPVQSGCEQYRPLVAQYSDWDVRTMLAIMHKESTQHGVICNRNAIGDGHLTYVQDGITYGMSCGVGQVRVLPGRPTCDQLHDPATNIATMHRIWQGQGYGAWSVYNHGLYLEVLSLY